jgi:hypothetical protein
MDEYLRSMDFHDTIRKTSHYLEARADISERQNPDDISTRMQNILDYCKNHHLQTTEDLQLLGVAVAYNLALDDALREEAKLFKRM